MDKNRFVKISSGKKKLEFENGKNRTAAILNGSIYFNELMIEMNN
jgi:hypothetical protein